jgi:hypothetical protein
VTIIWARSLRLCKRGLTLGEFGNLTHFFFADDIPTAETIVPKKRTLEGTLVFAAEQLTVLEATEWTTGALESALKKLGEEKPGQSRKTLCSSAPLSRAARCLLHFWKAWPSSAKPVRSIAFAAPSTRRRNSLRQRNNSTGEQHHI